jgi:hypothetical protein
MVFSLNSERLCETFGASFDLAAVRRPDREAFVGANDHCRDEARGGPACGWPAALGLQPGGRIGIWSPTAPPGC